MNKVSKGTTNEGASILERTIDGISMYRDLFDDFYFDEFDSVAQEIDELEQVMQDKISELEEEKRSLIDEIEDLKKQLEELNNDN